MKIFFTILVLLPFWGSCSSSSSNSLGLDESTNTYAVTQEDASMNTVKQTDRKVVETPIQKTYTKVISDPTNKLSNKIELLEVEYTVWGCECPNWIKTKDKQRNDTTKSYIQQHFYLEPANKSLELPIDFDPFKHRLKIRGQFYAREDYPQRTVEMEEKMPKAKVFRYTKIEVIKNK